MATKHVRLLKVKGTEHPPDMGTKHLSREALAKCIDMVGLKWFSEIGIALVGTVSKSARVGLAMLLLAAGGTAQEVEAPAVSPAAASLAVERQPWMAEGLLLSIVLVLAVIAMRVYTSQPRARISVDVGTQTSSGEVPPPEVWITPFGRKAHSRATCHHLARCTPERYMLCRACGRACEERSCG